MKKLCLLIAVICLLTLPVKAQMEKGKILTSVISLLADDYDLGSELMSLGYLTYKQGSETIKDLTLNLQPRVGYFVIDNLAVGIDVVLHVCSERTKDNANDNFDHRILGIGPFLRYYYPLEKVYPFVEAKAIFGQEFSKRTNWEYKENGKIYSLGIGGAFPLGDRITFDALLGYGYGVWKGDEEQYDNTIGGVEIGLGFTIFFLKK
jgi:hypothetical protein